MLYKWAFLLCVVLCAGFGAANEKASKSSESSKISESSKSGNNAANRLEVKAKSFWSNDAKQITELKDNVFIKKGNDKLWADLVIIKTDANRKPLEYTASGNVSFYFETADGKKIDGNAQKVVYDAVSDEYRLYENAKIKELGTPNVITGDMIILNNKEGMAHSQGSSKRPTTLIFELED